MPSLTVVLSHQDGADNRCDGGDRLLMDLERDFMRTCNDEVVRRVP